MNAISDCDYFYIHHGGASFQNDRGWNFGLNWSVMVPKVTVIRVTDTPVFLPIALLCRQTMDDEIGLAAIGIASRGLSCDMREVL